MESEWREKRDEKQEASVRESSTDLSPRLSANEGVLTAANVTGTRDAFETAGLEKYYEPVASYEGAHRFDPDFQWEAKEEKRVVRKLDWRICSWVCLAFFALQLDRGNISQANSDGMLKDLHITTDDFNTGQTIFYVTFLAAELPSQMISKRIGPDRWLPIQMICWSLVASTQAFMTDRRSFFACRALLGIFEGGFIPNNILYLSYWYTSKELPTRLSFFFTSYQFTYIISAFLGYGILHLRGTDHRAGWSWLFAIEGLLTGVIGILTWFYLPPSPTQTASRFRGKHGWFSERDEKIMVNRVLRDDPSKGDMNNRQAVDLRMFWRTLCDVDMWPIYLLGVCYLLPFIPAQQYLTLLLGSDGFSTFETNLLSIPSYVIFIANLLFWTYASEWLNERFLLSTVVQFWCLGPLVALEVLPAGKAGNLKWGRYAATTLLNGAPYFQAAIAAVTSRNAGSVRTRTVAIAIYNMMVQVGLIIGANVYRKDDAPLYRKANKALLGVVAFNVVYTVGVKLYYVRKNQRRERVWSKMSQGEKEQYLATTTDEGNRRLDFRFAH